MNSRDRFLSEAITTVAQLRERYEAVTQLATLASEQFVTQFCDSVRAEKHCYGLDREVEILCAAGKLLTAGVKEEDILQFDVADIIAVAKIIGGMKK